MRAIQAVMVAAVVSGPGASVWASGTDSRWEAEACVVNAEAYRRDRASDTYWNLWSRDRGAETKWSGGVVLQSPKVLEERTSSAQGAPPLHLRRTGLAPGRYMLVMGIGRVLAFSTDAETWQRLESGSAFPVEIGDDGVLEWWVDDRYAVENEDGRGAGYLDWVQLTTLPAGRLVEGWAENRVEESLDRGLVATAGPDGVTLSWRLLASDPPDAGFDVFRIENGTAVSRSDAPVRRTTDFLDRAETEPGAVYEVRPHGFDGPSGRATARAATDGMTVRTLVLRDPEATVQRVAVADLNGDGVYDYVVKTPNANVDPWYKYWTQSPDTYRLSGYLADGTFLWEIDLGWSIERGVWYSPMLACDLTGDGRAEVVAKTGEGDPRDPDGKVTTGPEWITVWDGETGRELARTPWPSRDGFSEYNRWSRNQLAVAYLDGKTPCLLALRGTYGLMKVEAYQLLDGTLQPLWRYENTPYGKLYRGQGAHFTIAADIDDDGRDEVILGSAVLDDDGTPLWTTGKGHPDAAYLADVDPHHPGLEMAYVMESKQQTGGLCLADARTGTLLWELQEPTRHVHGKGLCADILPNAPGMELYGQDSDEHKTTGRAWLMAADGTLLEEGDSRHWGFRRTTAWWDADPQKELVTGHVHKPDGARLSPNWPGKLLQATDVFGDWREELIVFEPGLLKILGTTIPADDRRVCLMQDPVYRSTITMNANAYPQNATLSYALLPTFSNQPSDPTERPDAPP